MLLNPNDEPANDPRVVETTEVIEPSGANLVSKASAINPQRLAVGFDQQNNQTDAWEYGYGVGAPSTYPMRHVHTDYLAVNPANNVSYADPVNGNTYTANDVHLRAVPRARQIYSINPTNGIETLVAQSETRYDEPAYSLLTYGTVTSWNDPGSARGNATTSRNWVNTSNSWLETHAQYDQCGNVRNTWDAKGNQSQIEYSSDYVYAYPTLTRTPVPDPSAFVATNVFDFNTGLATSSTDANNVTTTLEYNDALNRPTRMVLAYGTSVQSQSSIAYDDVNRIITTTSDQSTYNDNVLKSQVIYDGLGRTLESRQYEGGTNYIAMQTQYDAMGRAFKTSSPFRPWNSESAVWTTAGFDALGRVVTITTPDNAVISTAYSGNSVTVTDQAGKQRQSVTDALGRLIQVYEDPAGLNYLTTYNYDTLDNLVTVNQGSQTRSFVYDSLKRLSSATNPESGAISYQYDANGNLTQKIDARSITTNYAYDALNRATSRSYSDGTPTMTYGYDPNIANGKGRLATVSSSISTYTYSSYDAMGRVLAGSQTLGAQSYPLAYSYDLAGHVVSMTYPSGRSVNYNYDNAGRLADKDATHLAFSGNVGDGTTRNYAQGLIYDASGRMTKEQFGTTTPIYSKLFYNSRGQLSEIRESTSYTGPTDTTFNRGAFINDYSLQCGGASCNATDNNGNLRKQTVHIPNNDQNTSPTSWYQQYEYDSLNRLTQVHEHASNTNLLWQQQCFYDRYGNRTIDYNNTSSNIPRPQFTVSTTNNRLGVPSGQTGTMSYDSSGNLTTDT